MNRVSTIGGLFKKSYRLYSNDLLSLLRERGFLDLRPSFLEILTYICENEGCSIKSIGQACGLKKQTMTSHLNELEKRGYIFRKKGEVDKREQNVFLTEMGEKFKFNLFESSSQLEESYKEIFGEVELDRLILILENFHNGLMTHKEENIPAKKTNREEFNLQFDL